MALLKPKDYVTSLNIVCGFGSMVCSMKGMLDWAAYLVIIGYIFDSLDGVVARLTGGGNKFGAELDNVADLVSYSIAPAVLVTAHYDQWTEVLGRATFPVAVLLGIFPAVFGCVRFARFNVKRIEYPGVWFGVPRPASGIAVAAFLSSRFFVSDVGHYVGMGLIPLLSIGNVALWPCVGHHERKFKLWEKTGIAFMFVSWGVAVPLGLLWDVLLFWIVFYISLGWFYLSREERARVRAFVAEWRKGDN